MPETFLGAVRVPPFPEGRTWCNVARPLTTADLRGRMTILDFWTSCCINCMHILPHLHAIEAAFADEVVVIGVHSAKFTAEQDDRHLGAAIQRLGITHPIINDHDMFIWRSYAVRAWPTLMFVDPRGRVVGQHQGEFALDEMLALIAEMLREYREAGLLHSDPPLPASGSPPASATTPNGPLAFPAAVLHDPLRQQLHIADSSHHQIMIADHIAGRDSATVVQRIGSGQAGFADGAATDAQFRAPQGLALVDDTLIVADTGNHSIRAIDLQTGVVRTLAGTGQQARPYRSYGPALATPLSSPWGLAVTTDDGGHVLWMAMAGQHQLWRLPLVAPGDEATVEVRRYAGSGHEALRDGGRARAHLAQPSGLVALGNAQLAFTDSETSAVRLLDLPLAAPTPPDPDTGDDAGPHDTVRTLIGEGLFTFGDVDGDSSTARLQHPLGIAHDAQRNLLYIADTYNNRVKRLDLASGLLTTWLGSGEPALRAGVGADAAFFEPNSLHVSGGRLYIADTNNHAVRCADLDTGAVTTLTLVDA